MPSWYEQFFGGLYSHVLAHQFDDATSLKQARLVKRLLKVRQGARVLDIPCGQGRLTLPLARMGLEMTGVDLTPSYVRKARRLARREGLAARFLCRDMRRIDFDGEFDAAFNWFSSFGYFSDADDLAFLKRVLAALRPGGRFAIEMINKSFVVAHLRRTHRHVFGGVDVCVRNRWDAQTSRMVSLWTFRRGKAAERHRTCNRLYNGHDMRGVLRQAGFRDVALVGWPPVGRLTRHSRRLIALARRPGG